MKKYYVANIEKTEFAYITTIPGWCRYGGETRLMSDDKPHLFSEERAKRVMSKLKRENLANKYQIFSIEIS